MLEVTQNRGENLGRGLWSKREIEPRELYLDEVEIAAQLKIRVVEPRYRAPVSVPMVIEQRGFDLTFRQSAPLVRELVAAAKIKVRAGVGGVAKEKRLQHRNRFVETALAVERFRLLKHIRIAWVAAPDEGKADPGDRYANSAFSIL
jgi:hypothetical protein